MTIGGRLLAGFAAAALSTAPTAAKGPDRTKLRAIDRAFADAYAAAPHGGLTVGVVANGRLVWTKSYGFADRAKGRRATRNTVYRIGSITKQFTAVAYMRLLAAGRLRGDQRVAEVYAPLRTIRATPQQIDAITFDGLATHRSGLAREPKDMRFLTGPIDRWQATLAGALADTSVDFPALAAPHYSNIGYGTLGAALEVVAGTPYIDQVERGIMAPLGMRHSGFRPTPAMLAELAQGYEMGATGEDSTESAKELRDGRGYKIPNGGIFTTVDDLARFVAFEIDGKSGVLSRDRLAADRAASYLSAGTRWGRGVYQTTPGVFGHGGAVAGFRAGAYFDPDHRVGVVCLRNFGDGLCGSRWVESVVTFLTTPGTTLTPASAPEKP